MIIERTTVPPCGFNAYDCWGADINEERALRLVDAFSQILFPHGFEYFCFDAGWFYDSYYMERIHDEDSAEARKNMDEYGRLMPSVVKFPNGFNPIIERCHRLGFKFGLHFMRGIPRSAVEQNCKIYGTAYAASEIADFDDDCAWGRGNVGVDMEKPGAQQYYDSVISYLADQGVDFVKLDDIAEHPREIEAVSKAIQKVERPILLSLSPGDNVFKKNLSTIRKCGNMLRITGDVWDRAWDLQKVFDRWEEWEELGSEECWLDLDMIPFGLLQAYIPEGLPKDHVPHDLNEKRLSRLTKVEKQTFMTQRALAASPLFFGGELTMTPDEDLAIATNAHMLRCNRNGVVAQRIYGERNIDIRKVFRKGSEQHGWIGIFNRKGVAYRFQVPCEAFGFQNPEMLSRLRDIWTGRPLTVSEGKVLFDTEPWQCFFAEF